MEKTADFPVFLQLVTDILKMLQKVINIYNVKYR